jgi:NAD(P)-dependent dehydrogenase (short-subunit alcohol dehydrogenase family)
MPLREVKRNYSEKPFIDPSEIANLVAYLPSPLSIATNGAALRADGGVLSTIL